MSARHVEYYGIRHHGPGSARRLLDALQQTKPNVVLIEGPADCSELLPLLAHAQMTPPISLLAYSKDNTAHNIYYPAKLAGYEDGESWWNDLIEQNASSHADEQDYRAVFDAVESAMTALRDQCDPDTTLANNSEDATSGTHPFNEDLSVSQLREQQREAFMRLEIAKFAKSKESKVAVVCGAWHVPALKQKQTAKRDRTVLKFLPTKLAKSKVKSTWVPWTSPRLASSYGYGAGVSSPKWYEHLWRHSHKENNIEYWLVKVAMVLREHGQVMSTASVIEAVRLSNTMASLRNRPLPGFEEIRDAVIACLCFGEALLWKQIEQQLLLGSDVGSVPDSIELVPLLEDLQRLQKQTKLKPEALPKEVSIDLRSQIGTLKSVLLHRLNTLGVNWGELSDTGKSRGTFREKWQLCWQPEHAIALIENLSYGSTIELAANNRLCEALATERQLNRLAEGVQHALASQLHKAVELGLERLSICASQTSDCAELLQSIPPLIDISRYGTARDISLGQVEALLERMSTQAALSLSYACRNLNDEEAQIFRVYISSAFDALQLGEANKTLLDLWFDAFKELVDHSQSSFLIAGLCTRLLYQAEKLASEQLQEYLQRALSPAIPAMDAARFFEGFFTGAAQRLLYDPMLLTSVEHWLLNLDEDTFIEFLPLFRRIFSDLDAIVSL